MNGKCYETQHLKHAVSYGFKHFLGPFFFRLINSNHIISWIFSNYKNKFVFSLIEVSLYMELDSMKNKGALTSKTLKAQFKFRLFFGPKEKFCWKLNFHRRKFSNFGTLRKSKLGIGSSPVWRFLVLSVVLVQRVRTAWICPIQCLQNQRQCGGFLHCNTALVSGLGGQALDLWSLSLKHQHAPFVVF